MMRRWSRDFAARTIFSSARPTSMNLRWAPRPRIRRLVPRGIPGTRRISPVVQAAARRPPWRRTCALPLWGRIQAARSATRRVLRGRRAEAHVWPCVAVWLGGLCIVTGPDRHLDERRAGRGHLAQGHRGTRPTGFHVRGCRRARLFEVAQDQHAWDEGRRAEGVLYR